MGEEPAGQSSFAVLTSGGDAGGMNSAVRAVVRPARHPEATSMRSSRVTRGRAGGPLIRRFETADVGGIRQRGGTVIGTARSRAFSIREGRRRAADRPKAAGVGAHRALRSEDGKRAWTRRNEDGRAERLRPDAERRQGISLPISATAAGMGSPIADRYRRPPLHSPLIHCVPAIRTCLRTPPT
jgi:hypothetical protein